MDELYVEEKRKQITKQENVGGAAAREDNCTRIGKNSDIQIHINESAEKRWIIM